MSYGEVRAQLGTRTINSVELTMKVVVRVVRKRRGVSVVERPPTYVTPEAA